MSDSFGLLADSLGWALLHSLWQIALAAGMVWTGLRLTAHGRPALRFAIAYLGMIGAFAAFVITLLSYLAAARTGIALPAASAPPPAVALPFQAWLGETVWAVSLAWALGFTILGMRYARALGSTLRLRHDGVSRVARHWEIGFAAWAARLGVDGATIIRQSARVAGPVTIGALRPIVLVPIGFFLRLPRDQAEAILIHELAHIRRQDYALGLIQEMIKTVFFFHPCIFWLSRLVDAEREFACDDMVLVETGDARALARGLSRVAAGEMRFAMAARRAPAPLLDRVRRLGLGHSDRRDGAPGLATAGSLMLLALSFLVALGGDASMRGGGVAREASPLAAPVRLASVVAPDEPNDASRIVATVENNSSPVLPGALDYPSTPALAPELVATVEPKPAPTTGSTRSEFARAVALDASGRDRFRFAIAQAFFDAPNVSDAAVVWVGQHDNGLAEHARGEAERAMADAEREIAVATREAEHASELAGAVGERAGRIVERHSARLAALADRLADRHIALGEIWRTMAKADREAVELAVADLEREVAALEIEIERAAEAMEREIERSLEALDIAALDRPGHAS